MQGNRAQKWRVLVDFDGTIAPDDRTGRDGFDRANCKCSHAQAGRRLAISEGDLENASVTAALLLAPHDLQRLALDPIQVTFAVACKREDNLGETMAPIFHD